jgi:hypothetical protein
MAKSQCADVEKQLQRRNLLEAATDWPDLLEKTFQTADLDKVAMPSRPN